MESLGKMIKTDLAGDTSMHMGVGSNAQTYHNKWFHKNVLVSRAYFAT